jgi:hypothetical protein
MRECKKCNQKKELDLFSINKSATSWISWVCRDCNNLRQRTRAHNNPKVRLKHIYDSMLSRCNRSNHKSYHRYWWRGICVKRNSFEEFYNDMWPLYIKHWEKYWYGVKTCQLDREDNNWNYSKENCRFISCLENANNKETTRKFLYNWEELSLRQIHSKYATNNLKIKTFAHRIYNMKLSIQEGLDMKLQQCYYLYKWKEYQLKDIYKLFYKWNMKYDAFRHQAEKRWIKIDDLLLR